MSGLTILFIVLSAITVFVIAAVTVGREARRLDAMPPRAVYEIETAVSYVAERLPPETQARLTLDELSQLLVLHLNWLHERGLQPDKAVDHRQDIDDEVVVEADLLTAYLLGEAERAGVEVLDDVDVVNVTDAHLAYFEAIGAVGPQADEP
jgi:hypothetical protein